MNRDDIPIAVGMCVAAVGWLFISFTASPWISVGGALVTFTILIALDDLVRAVRDLYPRLEGGKVSSEQTKAPLKEPEATPSGEIVLQLYEVGPEEISKALRETEGRRLKLLIGDDEIRIRDELLLWEPIHRDRLRTRSYMALRRSRYQYVHELQLTPRKRLAKVPQIGKEGLKDIAEYLETLGVTFAGE
jgi:hypothetical protein